MRQQNLHQSPSAKTISSSTSVPKSLKPQSVSVKKRRPPGSKVINKRNLVNCSKVSIKSGKAETVTGKNTGLSSPSLKQSQASESHKSGWNSDKPKVSQPNTDRSALSTRSARHKHHVTFDLDSSEKAASDSSARVSEESQRERKSDETESVSKPKLGANTKKEGRKAPRVQKKLRFLKHRIPKRDLKNSPSEDAFAFSLEVRPKKVLGKSKKKKLVVHDPLEGFGATGLVPRSQSSTNLCSNNPEVRGQSSRRQMQKTNLPGGSRPLHPSLRSQSQDSLRNKGRRFIRNIKFLLEGASQGGFQIKNGSAQSKEGNVRETAEKETIAALFEFIDRSKSRKRRFRVGRKKTKEPRKVESVVLNQDEKKGQMKANVVEKPALEQQPEKSYGKRQTLTSALQKQQQRQVFKVGEGILGENALEVKNSLARPSAPTINEGSNVDKKEVEFERVPKEFQKPLLVPARRNKTRRKRRQAGRHPTKRPSHPSDATEFRPHAEPGQRGSARDLETERAVVREDGSDIVSFAATRPQTKAVGPGLVSPQMVGMLQVSDNNCNSLRKAESLGDVTTVEMQDSDMTCSNYNTAESVSSETDSKPTHSKHIGGKGGVFSKKSPAPAKDSIRYKESGGKRKAASLSSQPTGVVQPTPGQSNLKKKSSKRSNDTPTKQRFERAAGLSNALSVVELSTAPKSTYTMGRSMSNSFTQAHKPSTKTQMHKNSQSCSVRTGPANDNATVERSDNHYVVCSTTLQKKSTPDSAKTSNTNANMVRRRAKNSSSGRNKNVNLNMHSDEAEKAEEADAASLRSSSGAGRDKAGEEEEEHREEEHAKEEESDMQSGTEPTTTATSNKGVRSYGRARKVRRTQKPNVEYSSTPTPTPVVKSQTHRKPFTFKGWDMGKELAAHTMTELPSHTDIAEMLLKRAAKLREREAAILSHACTGPQSYPISDADDAKIYLAQNSIQEIFTDFTTTLLNESPARPRDHVMELAQQLDKQTKIKNELVANFPFLSTKESRARLRDRVCKFKAKTDQEVTISASSENAVMDDSNVIGRNNQKRQSTISSNVTSQPTELPDSSSDSDDLGRTSFETNDNVGQNNRHKGSSESSIWGISRAVSGLDSVFNVSDLDTEGFAVGSIASSGTFLVAGAAHAATSPKFTGCPPSKEDLAEEKGVNGKDDDGFLGECSEKENTKS